jgi:membrane protease YdiL (CAAX protease family)
VLASTALFVAAHLGYQQPWMLVGVTLLSLFFAMLARWRQSVWAAVTAHAVFDAVQLLWLVPLALDASGTPSSP